MKCLANPNRYSTHMWSRSKDLLTQKELIFNVRFFLRIGNENPELSIPSTWRVAHVKPVVTESSNFSVWPTFRTERLKATLKFVQHSILIGIVGLYSALKTCKIRPLAYEQQVVLPCTRIIALAGNCSYQWSRLKSYEICFMTLIVAQASWFKSAFFRALYFQTLSIKLNQEATVGLSRCMIQNGVPPSG